MEKAAIGTTLYGENGTIAKAKHLEVGTHLHFPGSAIQLLHKVRFVLKFARSISALRMSSIV